MDQAIATTPRRMYPALLVPLLAVAVVIGSSAAAVSVEDAGSDIIIVNPIYHEDRDGIAVAGGPFTATGAAVGDGLLCATGTLSELYGHGIMTTVDDFRVLVIKELTCDDRPGALTVALWVDRIEGVGNEFEWQALWGTEDLEGICGSGEGTGMWAEDPTVIDSYRGQLYSGNRCERNGP